MTNRPQWPYESWPSVLTNDLDEIETNVHEEPTVDNGNSASKSDQNDHKEQFTSSTPSFVASSEKNDENERTSVGDKTVDTKNGFDNDIDYELSEPLLSNNRESLETTNSESSQNEWDSYEPDHWNDELEYNFSDDIPINILLKSIVPHSFCQDEAADIRTTLVNTIDMTLKTLTAEYKVFKDSYFFSVGSMDENTKIGRADEFDFAVIVPTLSSKEVICLFHDREKAAKDSTVMSFISDIWSGDLKSATCFFQYGLRSLWYTHMTDFIPKEWVILNPTGHTNSNSVAATFHLERKADNYRVDIDVCFWAPLTKECLNEDFISKSPHAEYVLSTCVDEDGRVYAILPVDNCIEYSTNIVRFAMSKLEKAALQKLGTDSTVIECYKTCKCIIASLLPRIKKKKECGYCYESVISSYALKNVILYMVNNHKSKTLWTHDKLPNRVIEVFTILCFCIKVNTCQISAYFTPYVLSIDMIDTYEPNKKCLTTYDLDWIENEEIPCIIPNLTSIKDLFPEDASSHKALVDFEDFLKNSNWRHPEVICRVTELLSNLAQITEEDRLEMVKEPGWNLFGLDFLDKTGTGVFSVNTYL